ncbi:MAG: tRNA glutamyl-Q(34) synthetase GluQRS [Alphaproteobacteria bacterium]|nr:tRNA glutamyl-Q(34) synthetase GluQRS [Alphaproteobacteria bacterium]
MRTVIVTRFAPSPTGRLHLGHAFSALFAERAARAAGGRFLLRLEDIDRGRCRPAFATGIIEDLTWLGVRWDGAVRVQSEHFGDYRSALDRLRERGLLYPCFCTRKDIQDEIARAGHAPHGPDGVLYPGICRGLDAADAERRIAAGTPYALRLDMARALAVTSSPLTFADRDAGTVSADPAQFGDVVLARKDVPTSYHLAVTVDDALQGVTLVTRGLDLLASTHVHRLLQALLDLPVPDYHHHRLLTDAAGERLAKRADAVSLATLRAQGETPAALRARLGF